MSDDLEENGGKVSIGGRTFSILLFCLLRSSSLTS